VNFRKINIALHRDVGYLAVGLTIIYGISGLALNHVGHWNPNYKKNQQILQMQPLDPGLGQDELARLAVAQLKLDAPKAVFQPDENTLRLIYKDSTVSVDLPTGQAIKEETKPRPVLYEMNRLHLNAPKKAWTYISDLYALSMIFLAISGMFIIKGKKGMAGRGAWLAAIGAAIPVVYWLWWTMRLGVP
jgi:hypothetical protein